MSGLEVIGGISAVIAIIDGSVKVWKSAQRDLKLSETFETVGNRLPILRDTLQTCHEHFEPIQNTLPANAAESLLKTIKSCESKAGRLRTIFEETIAGKDEQWYERYRKVAKRLGKGSKVEELMKSITEDTQHLVNYHAVKSAKPELCTKLEDLIKEMEAVEPSLPSNEVESQIFNAYGGPQNVSTGSSTQYISFNTGSGETHNYGGIQGNPVFNFGTVLSGRTNFSGSYAHSSLYPVSTYVRRPDLERQLHDQLLPLSNTDDRHEMRTVVVWGLGGSGKSQLVQNHVHKHRQQYRAVFWVEAGQKEAIERDFVQIHKLLWPSLASGSATITLEDAVTGVKNWLQGQEERCLWVMDSADDVEENESGSYINLNYYLPEAPQLDRIITTRSSRAQGMDSRGAVEVKEMAEEEAAELFRHCAQLKQMCESSNRDVLKIVRELGCLALGVMLAGSYVHETPGLSSDLGRYLQDFRSSRKRLLSQKARRLVHQYGESVLSTWEISFCAVQQQSMVAAQLLSLLAFLNFDDIFLQLFTIRSTTSQEDDHASRARRIWSRKRFRRLLKGHQESSQDVNSWNPLKGPRWMRLLSPDATTIDDNAIISAFTTLQAYSLVSWRADQEAYSMHKLVHAWSQDRLGLEQRQEWSAAVLELLSDVIQDYKGNLAIEKRLVPHVMANFTAILSAYRLSYRMPDRDRECVKRAGNLLKNLGRWDDEHEVRVFLKRMTELVLGRKHPDTLWSMNNLAGVLSHQGKYEEAEKMHRQTLEVRKKVSGQEHPDTLTSMNNLASVLDKQGKYEEAETMHRQTLELRKKVSGQEHPETLTSMNNLATVLSGQGKYEEAEATHRQTLELRRKVSGQEHPYTLTSMNNLAAVLSRQGKYVEAEATHRQTLEVRKKVSGQEHSDTLTSMNDLALVLDEQGKYEEAETTHRQTLELRKKVSGQEHPYTLTSMNNLAAVLSRQGKYVEAETMHRQTLEVRKKVLGQEHPDTLTSMNDLALVLDEQGKYEEAETTHRQTLELRRKVSGQEHPETLTSMNNLAAVLSRRGKYEEAETMHRQTLEVRKKVLGQEHPSTLTSMNNLATVLSDQGKYEEAGATHRQTLEVRRKVLGKEHPSTLTSMNNLALVLSGQGKCEEAEQMYRQTSNLIEKVLGQEHPFTLTSINNLAEVLDKQGKYEQAKEVRQRTIPVR